ncbi:MAG: GNAT family N-acetyltransferase [Paracoccaceae bacterium]
MADYMGSEASIALQKRIHARRSMIENSPWIASGGRVMIYVEPDATTWPSARALAEEDGFLALVVMDREQLDAAVAHGLGDGWRTDYWDAFLGAPPEVLAASRRVVDTTPLPAGWRLDATLAPNHDEIDQVQRLNLATGVSPNPAVVGACPTLSVMVRDSAGELVASAAACMFFHPQSRLGGTVFVGLVSVDPKARGKGLGKLANARALIDSHAAMGWTQATEFVAADNPASRAMVAASGLTVDAGLVTAIATRGAERFTR